MPKTIKVDPDAIKGYARELRAIDTGFPGSKSSGMPTTDMQGSSGNAPDALHGIDQEYSSLAASLRTLIDNTADFLDQVAEANTETDNSTAQQFTGKE